MRSIISIAVALAVMAGTANAQTRKPLTGNPVTDIQNAVTGAQTKIVNDLTTVMKQLEGMVDTADAIALSTQIPGLQDTVGNACWKSFDGLSQVMKAHPLPVSLKIAPDIEAIRLAAMALNQICTNPNCGQMWTDAQNAATALNVTPMQFSLPSICAKIPAIGTLAGAAVVPVTPAANALGGSPTVTPPAATPPN